MSRILPKGADLLADIRRQGYRPSGLVFVFLDTDRPRQKIYSDIPLSLEIFIRPGDVIEDLDFGTLRDLDVNVHGGHELNDRLRSALKAITNAQPRFLMGAVPDENLMFAWHPVRGWEFDHVE